MARRPRAAALLAAALLAAALAGPPAARARSLQSVRARGELGLCAHPNALPFASRKDDPPGFQVELGRAIAGKLGVSLLPVWIIGPGQIRRAECDMVLDAIAERDAQDETGLRLSKPYYRTSVVLAVRPDSRIAAVRDLDRSTRVGVAAGSVASMLLDQKGVPISVFGWEDEMLEAMADGRIDAAAVSAAAAGYYNATHPDRAARIIRADDLEPRLGWNVAVGLVRPDADLRGAIDGALTDLLADGTVARIYGRYGIALQPPR